MLRIELDGIIFSLQNIGGISVYHSELLKCAAPDITYLVGLPGAVRINPELLSLGTRADAMEIPQRHYPTRRFERVRRFQLDAEFHAQVVHTSYYRTLAGAHVPLVVTAHDFVVEAFGPRNARQYLHVIQKKHALKKATKIIAISDSTRNDLERLYGAQLAEKVTVVRNGISDAFRTVAGSHRKNQVVFVGSRAGYKGFGIAVDTVARMADMRLLVIGGGPLSGAERTLLETRLPGKFEHCGYVSQSELVSAYNASLFLLYPSSYEGFGIPPLEAARCGCVPVVFDTSSLPEVVGTPETIFPLGTNSADIAAELAAMSTSKMEQLRTRGIEFSQQFSWRKCAVETEQVLQSAAA